MDITIRLKTNYIVICTISLVGLLLGSYFAWLGLDWYKSLIVPSIMPPLWVIRSAWHIIFALTTLAALLVWNKFHRDFLYIIIMLLFGINLFLNVCWTYLFFCQHKIGAALVDAFLLEASTMLLLVCISHRSRTIALLLLPYVVWNLFEIILN